MKRALKIIIIFGLLIFLFSYVSYVHYYLPTRLEISSLQFPSYLDSNLNYIEQKAFYPGDYLYILTEINNLFPEYNTISFSTDILTFTNSVVVDSLTGPLETINSNAEYISGYYPYATKIALPYNLDSGEYELRLKITDNNKDRSTFATKSFTINNGLNIAKTSFCNDFTLEEGCIPSSGIFLQGESLLLYSEISGFKQTIDNSQYFHSLALQYSVFQNNKLVFSGNNTIFNEQTETKLKYSPYIELIDTSFLSPGVYVLKLSAKDLLADKSVSEEIIFVID